MFNNNQYLNQHIMYLQQTLKTVMSSTQMLKCPGAARLWEA